MPSLSIIQYVQSLAEVDLYSISDSLTHDINLMTRKLKQTKANTTYLMLKPLWRSVSTRTAHPAWELGQRKADCFTLHRN